MMSVKFNGQELAVTSMDISIERDEVDPFSDDFGMLMPRLNTFTAKLKINPDFNLYEVFNMQRKLIVTMASDEHMQTWRAMSTKLEINYKDVRWRIYRRDYKRRRIYLREVLDK